MSGVQGKLLHPESFQSPFGEGLEGALLDQMVAFGRDANANPAETPGISVVIQSCNDTPDRIHRLFDDFDAQDYPPDAVQYIVASGGNSDETLRAAAARNAVIVHEELGSGFRADILNTGLEAADNELVFTTIGHAALSNNLVLRAAAFHGAQSEVMAAYGIVLPDDNATVTERVGARYLGTEDILRGGPTIATEPGMGLLAADCSVVKKLCLGGHPYDPKFGAGGMDGRLGEILVGSEEKLKEIGDPYRIVREGILSVHHTHGFGPVNSLRQFLAWRGMAEPRRYNPAEWAWHPHGGL